MDPHSEWLEYQVADSKHSGRARRGADEQAEGDLPESAVSGETDQEDPSDKPQESRRVPGLHGYDPNQWPDARV